VLKWGEQEGADVIAYNLYRKAPPTNTFGLVNSVTGTTFTDTALEPGKPAVYAVTALDSSFVETAFSAELPVVRAPKSVDELGAAGLKWQLRRTRLIAMVTSGDQPFSRPADVAVGPVSGDVYVADSGRNRIFVFNARGGFQRTIGAGGGGASAFQRVIGLGVDRDETVYAVDAGRGDIFAFGSQGGEGRRLPIAARTGRVRGLADCAVGANGKLFVVDNSNDEVLHSGRSGAVGAFGASGFRPGELAAPTFCATDDAGNFYVADTLNARVQIFSGAGEFMRAFGRGRRGAGGMLRPKGVAVAANGEIYVADSWQNSVQVFAATGQHLAVLADENGNALDLGSPNGVALGAGNMIYIAERLSARLQIREIMDEAR
jgi:DNA-binding beta-propeller fold protein YncE